MVRVFTIFLMLYAFAFANLQDKIENFISLKNYTKQKSLIKVLFRDTDNFYKQSDGNVDSLKVIKVLEDNGLFELFYKSPVFLKIKFVTHKNPLIFMKIIKESLKAIGYNYFLTQRATKKENEFIWIINLKTKHLIDPIAFSKELQKRGCLVEDVGRESDNLWTYQINSKYAKLIARNIDLDMPIKLLKPIEPYLIYADSAKSIKIRTSISDHWYPYIVFLDSALHVISKIKIDARKYTIKLDIPKSCTYIKIDDMYTLDNIKHGLSIFLNSEN